MFALCNTPLDAHPWTQEPISQQCGAWVVFIGRVRCRNNGRVVGRLEFEGAVALAENEFARIEAEARARFAIAEIRCLHRVGTLVVGETAVWLGVGGAHRDASFAACRYVIDELKRRLPIWKKEHYDNGDSGWLNHP